MNTTCCIIKPDAFMNGTWGQILENLSRTFTIDVLVTRPLTAANVDLIWYRARERFARDYWQCFMAFMTSAPSVAMILRGDPLLVNTVPRLRDLIGATNPREAGLNTLRYRFGDASAGAPIYRNAIHGSADDVEAELEIEELFRKPGLIS